MVNSDDSSNNRVSPWSRYISRKASPKPQPPSEQPAAGNFFQQPQLRRVDTQPGSSELALLADGRIYGNKYLTRHHAQFSLLPLSLMHRRMASPLIAGLHHLNRLSPIYKPRYPIFLSNTCIILFCPFFSPTAYIFSFFLIFLLSPTPLKLLSQSRVVLFLLKYCLR